MEPLCASEGITVKRKGPEEKKQVYFTDGRGGDNRRGVLLPSLEHARKSSG